MRIDCPKCHHAFNEPANLNSQAGDALRELVELKRMKDMGGDAAAGNMLEYRRRKLIAWQNAFRVCGIIGEPKP